MLSGSPEGLDAMDWTIKFVVNTYLLLPGAQNIQAFIEFLNNGKCLWLIYATYHSAWKFCTCGRNVLHFKCIFIYRIIIVFFNTIDKYLLLLETAYVTILR